jgi:hypothetical protein
MAQHSSGANGDKKEAEGDGGKKDGDAKVMFSRLRMDGGGRRKISVKEGVEDWWEGRGWREEKEGELTSFRVARRRRRATISHRSPSNRPIASIVFYPSPSTLAPRKRKRIPRIPPRQKKELVCVLPSLFFLIGGALAEIYEHFAQDCFFAY